MSMLRNITRGLRSLFRTEQVDHEWDEERGSRKFGPPTENIGFAQVSVHGGYTETSQRALGDHRSRCDFPEADFSGEPLV